MIILITLLLFIGDIILLVHEVIERRNNRRYARITVAEWDRFSDAMHTQVLTTSSISVGEIAFLRCEFEQRMKEVAALALVPPCGFVPPTPGYAPCTREADHDGPCAHSLIGTTFPLAAVSTTIPTLDYGHTWSANEVADEITFQNTLDDQVLTPGKA
jgi:hypothetical protein